MSRIFLFLSFVLMLSPIASMTAASAQQGHDACARDVTRFCRALMEADEMTVLTCLKQHRSRLSKACEKILTENGQ